MHLSAFLVVFLLPCMLDAFCLQPPFCLTSSCRKQVSFSPLCYNSKDDREGDDGLQGGERSEDRDERLQRELAVRLENLVMIEELSLKVEAARLEERNLRSRLKARPKFLPFEECKKWVQAWGRRWETEQEWREWIEMGEKVSEGVSKQSTSARLLLLNSLCVPSHPQRNAYIPSDPEEYYTRMGTWQGWDDFLGT